MKLPVGRPRLPHMERAPKITVYATEYILWQQRKGKNRFFAELEHALSPLGWALAFRPDTMDERVASAARAGYALFYEHEPFPPNALTVRRSYLEPFWQIETSAKRWEWGVASAAFTPVTIDQKRAETFCKFWRGKLSLPDRAPLDGTLLVPLQGRLLDKRSFQSASPLDMVRATLAHCPDYRLILTTHPGEVYTPEERAALAALAEDPRITLSDRPSRDFMPSCVGVVTENSSVALQALFLHKPIVLFAQIDFHHLAGSVPHIGVESAFEAIKKEPDPVMVERYLFWFFQKQALNVWRKDFPERLVQRLHLHGWPVGQTT